MKKIILLFPLFIFAYLIKLNNVCFDEYYETDYKIPVLAYYNLTKEEIEKANPKRRSFTIDRRLSEQFRTRSSDYTKQICINQRCDRGHQVANDIVDYNLTCQKLAFKMSNITPQTRAFNRSTWKKIEDKEKDLAVKYGNIFVIEGNFSGFENYGKIKNDIIVPKYFFKLIFHNKQLIYYKIVDQKGNECNITKLNKYPYKDKLLTILLEYLNK